jgi:RNA polymerase sigma factor (sigma-70 family)
MTEGKDYILQVRVKNGPLLRAMRVKGYETAAAFSRACGVSNSLIGLYLALRMLPISGDGEWKDSVNKMATCLGVMPGDLFPPAHIERALAKNVAEFEMDTSEVEALLENQRNEDTPETLLIAQEQSDSLEAMIAKLPPRSTDVIRRRFGLDGDVETLEEVGAALGVSRERVRQIEHRALVKMRQAEARKDLSWVGLPRRHR